jgi:hypothetical protein
MGPASVGLDSPTLLTEYVLNVTAATLVSSRVLGTESSGGIVIVIITTISTTTTTAAAATTTTTAAATTTTTTTAQARAEACVRALV